jgi:hypothetical protein
MDYSLEEVGGSQFLIGCTWVPLGLEVVSWRRRNIPISSVDLADLVLPRHLRRCGLAAGGGGNCSV